MYVYIYVCSGEKKEIYIKWSAFLMEILITRRIQGDLFKCLLYQRIIWKISKFLNILLLKFLLLSFFKILLI